MKIAVIPIDNRPICYDLIEDILSINKNYELFLPKIEYLGGLTTSANIDELFKFLENLDNIDYLIISLDTLAYGGLINSRRCPETFEEIEKRVLKLKEIIIQKNLKNKVYAFSSVMRISNNNINEEEKEYWSDYGKEIFNWSFNFHKTGVDLKTIPTEILEDYLNTRKRNFEINKLYLNLAKENIFNTLIFSKDDCAEFGLNIKEANELNEIIKLENIKNTLIKTGADEIPLGLISRAIVQNENIKINPIFVYENSKNLIPKYEDVTLETCVNGQIELANCVINKNDFDLSLFINNFEKEQGDLVLGEANFLNKEISFLKTPYFIADVNNANGADDKFIKELFKKNLNDYFGYCAYNTSANTLGCAILCAVVKFLAIKNEKYDDLAFRKIQFIRFLDDWAYQAISRKAIREKDENLTFSEALELKKEELTKNAKIIADFLNYYPEKIEYSLPWDRSFEIRIKLF